MRPELDAALRGNALSSYLPPLWKAGLGSFRRREKPYKLLPREIHTPTELQKEVEHCRNTLLLMTSPFVSEWKVGTVFWKNIEKVSYLGRGIFGIFKAAAKPVKSDFI